MKQDEINAVKKAAEKMRKQESAQDEIIEMARKAGLYQDINVSFHQALRNFYDLATAKEREACAKVAEHNFGVIGSTIALAIRARGEA
jgi:citrate lyase alpha subunit